VFPVHVLDLCSSFFISLPKNSVAGGFENSRPGFGVSLSMSAGHTIISEITSGQEQTTISNPFATDDAIYYDPVFSFRANELQRL
jgi:hypothetical protein